MMSEISKIKDLLHNYLIENKMFGNYTYGGGGINSWIFFVNGFAIKITKDLKQLKTAKHFKNNPHKSIVEYHQTDVKNKMGFIKMEILDTIDPHKNPKLIKCWSEIISADSIKNFPYEIEQHRMDILELRSDFDIDIRELHWGNAGFNLDGKLKFFSLTLNKLN